MKDQIDVKTILYTLSLLILSVLIGGCTKRKAVHSAPNPVKEVIMDGLSHPWSMAFIDANNVLITELSGSLLHVDLATKTKVAIADFPDDLFVPLFLDVSQYKPRTYPTSLDRKIVRGNAGILDVVLHPKFAENSEIFISYISQKEDTYALKVIKAGLVDNRLTNIRTILNPGPYVPGLWHFGGGLLVQDDHLYVTVGERLFFEDLKEGLPIAQDVTDARGGIYRLSLDGSIPNDNPNLGTDAVPGMYALGIRAAQGITGRPDTDEIWFSEHGTNQGDEINLLREGANYGWPNKTTGTWRSPGYLPDSLDGAVYTDPIHYWLQTVAPTGLVFYTGHEFPTWQGNLIVPGLSRGSMWRLVLENQTIVSAEELFLNDHVRSRKVMQSPDGHLYMLTDEDNGKLTRITNKSPR